MPIAPRIVVLHPLSVLGDARTRPVRPEAVLAAAIGIPVVLVLVLWSAVDPRAGVTEQRPQTQVTLLANGAPVPETRAPAGVPLQVRLGCPAGCRARVFLGSGSKPAEPLSGGPWLLRPASPPRVLDVDLVLDETPQGEWLEVEVCPPEHPGRCERLPFRLR